MTRSKKNLMVLVVVFICVAVYILRPKTFNNDIFKNENLSITYIESTVDNGEAVQNTKNFNFNFETSEFQQIKKTLEKFSYHICLDTLKGIASIENNNQTFILSSGKETIIITNVPNIIVGDKVYRVGYLGTSKISALNESLNDILNIK